MRVLSSFNLTLYPRVTSPPTHVLIFDVVVLLGGGPAAVVGGPVGEVPALQVEGLQLMPPQHRRGHCLAACNTPPGSDLGHKRGLSSTQRSMAVATAFPPATHYRTSESGHRTANVVSSLHGSHLRIQGPARVLYFGTRAAVTFHFFAGQAHGRGHFMGMPMPTLARDES